MNAAAALKWLCVAAATRYFAVSAASTNAAHVKAVIGIKPQNLNRPTNTDISGVNKLGMEVLKKFVTENKALSDLAKRKFYIVGRHRGNYRPEFGAVGLKEEQCAGLLMRLPDAKVHDEIFAYPPRMLPRRRLSCAAGRSGYFIRRKIR